MHREKVEAQHPTKEGEEGIPPHIEKEKHPTRQGNGREPQNKKDGQYQSPTHDLQNSSESNIDIL